MAWVVAGAGEGDGDNLTGAVIFEDFGAFICGFIGGILPTANALIGRSAPRESRGTVYGMTASATFLGNSAGPLSGGLIAAGLGIRWVFAMTTVLLLANLIWVYFMVPELKDDRS